MRVLSLLNEIKSLGIKTVAGVPDSTLKDFCGYLINNPGLFTHYSVPNEGSAVGAAAGVYLSTGTPACVYMQNSGIGNVVNPLTSIAHGDVYGIPILFIVGHRGEPGLPDEPQHKFMGRITEKMLDCMEIEHAAVDKNTSDTELKALFARANNALSGRKQFALIVKRNTFEDEATFNYRNGYSLIRGDVIEKIVERLEAKDLIVSTTGKISREVYERADKVLGGHERCFLTVGGMGHASMIAFGIAKNAPGRRIICLDGDGAALMHMGSMAFIAKHNPANLIHILLNNDAHESVGGMPTAAQGLDYAKLADGFGYATVFKVGDFAGLNGFLNRLPGLDCMTFAEIQVANYSGDGLPRPKETARENAEKFINNAKGR